MTAANALDGKSQAPDPHGLSWRYTRGSPLLGLVADDAAHLTEQIVARTRSP